MDNITDDLLTQILIRLLNCRQAVRCAAVCKRWSSLISASQFARSFIDHRHNSDSDFSATPLALLLQRHHYEYQKLPIIDSKFYQIIFYETLSSGTTSSSYLSFLPYDDAVIRAYCDDLLLVARANADYSGSFSFCICNPLTKKWCVLPEPPRGIVRLVKCALVRRRSSQNRERYCYSVALLFYMTCDYLRAMPSSTPEKVWSTVFSTETEQWSQLATVSPPPLMRWWRNINGRPFIFNEPVPCSDGVVYWLEGQLSQWECVVVFDPNPTADDNRECRHIVPPAEAGDEPNIMARVRLGACKGRLHVAFLSCVNDGVCVLKVWERKDCDNKENTGSCCWSILHDAVLEMEVQKCAFVQAFHPSNRDVVFVLVDHLHICRYDMSLRKGEKVGQLSECTSSPSKLTAYTLYSHWPTPVPSLQST